MQVRTTRRRAAGFPLSHGRARASAIQASVAVALIAASGACVADTADAIVKSLNPPMLEVNSNGTSYLQPAVALVSITAQIQVAVETGSLGKVKSWSAYLNATPKAPGQANMTVAFSQYKIGQQFNAAARPRSIHETMPVNIPYGTIAPYVSGQCNYLANALRQSGMKNAEIFGQDRTITVTFSPHLTADTTGAGQSNIIMEYRADAARDLQVVCKAHTVAVDPAVGQGPAGMQAKTEARLTNITATVLHSAHPASCPTEATARVVFVSDREGPFTWQFRSASGRVSSPVKLEMGLSDRQGGNYIKTYDQKFMIGPSASAGGGAAVGGNAVGAGLVPVPLPSGSHGGPKQNQAGGGALAAAPANVWQDGIRAVVMQAAPGSVQQSASAGYLVTCPASNPTPPTLHGSSSLTESGRPTPDTAGSGLKAPRALATRAPASR